MFSSSLNTDNYSSKLLVAYQNEWPDNPDFLDQLSHLFNDPDFLRDLNQFKIKINSKQHRHHARYQYTDLFLGSYYVSKTDAFNRLNEKIDSILPKIHLSELMNVLAECLYHVLKYLNDNPFQCLLFLLTLSYYMTMVAANQNIVTTHDNNNSHDNNSQENNSELTHSLINQTCSQKPFAIANKADGVRLGIFDHKFYPLSCIRYLRKQGREPMSTKCLQDYDKIKSENQKINEAVNKVDDERNKDKIYQALFVQEAQEITSRNLFTNEQFDQFNKYFKLLYDLHIAQRIAIYSKKIGTGKCREHADYNAIQILKINKTYNTFSKIQQVTVRDQNNDHVYLLIDSEIKDIEVVNNHAETEKILSNIKLGYICDSWNEGYYQNVTTNKNDFYRKWESVSIKTLVPEYFDLSVSDLPEDAVKFIQQKLSELDLSHLLKKNMPDQNNSESVKHFL